MPSSISRESNWSIGHHHSNRRKPRQKIRKRRIFQRKSSEATIHSSYSLGVQKMSDRRLSASHRQKIVKMKRRKDTTDNLRTESTTLRTASDQGDSQPINTPNSHRLSDGQTEEEMPTTSATAYSQVPEESADREPKERKNRCAECGKKVGLTGFTCRCGGLYCPVHRYSDRHNCTFDYRELGAEEIRRNNPTVTAEKIRKI